MAILAFLVSCLVKKSRQDTEEEEPKSFKSFMTMSKSKNAKKQKMPDADKEDQDDIQRQVMIRKSLASRASSRTTNRGSKGKAPMEDGDEEEDEEKDDDEEDEEEPARGRHPAGLKTDWKAYEADLQRNRSVLIRRHPGVDRSGGGSSMTPLSPIIATTPTSPTSPTSLISPTISSPPRPSPAPRQHTFPAISRKPVARTATAIPEYLVPSVVEKAQ
ncbi:hypothetical protein B0J13DRAFT_30686 [Dactylonectria estremocensis]|uniref:Uncharacterized protein n=1 Tax=Dactylonectria estremocensis TaxID=1079267 RepID=A0A9P9FK56_9HYPO|nr:hypothetical protein B0J13DRAFT_30686 [Dactylonectria estremocensis]